MKVIELSKLTPQNTDLSYEIQCIYQGLGVLSLEEFLHRLIDDNIELKQIEQRLQEAEEDALREKAELEELVQEQILEVKTQLEQINNSLKEVQEKTQSIREAVETLI